MTEFEKEQSGGVNFGSQGRHEQIRDVAGRDIHNYRDPILKSLDILVAEVQDLRSKIEDREIKSANSAYALNKASLLMNDKLERQGDTIAKVESKVDSLSEKVDKITGAALDVRITTLDVHITTMNKRFDRLIIGILLLSFFMLVQCATLVYVLIKLWGI